MRIKPRRVRNDKSQPKNKYTVEIGMEVLQTSAYNPRAAASNAIFRYAQLFNKPINVVVNDIKHYGAHCVVIDDDGQKMEYAQL